jgi:hypothetical protein
MNYPEVQDRSLRALEPFSSRVTGAVSEDRLDTQRYPQEDSGRTSRVGDMQKSDDDEQRRRQLRHQKPQSEHHQIRYPNRGPFPTEKRA